MLLHIETARGPLPPTGEVIESDPNKRRKVLPCSRRAKCIAAKSNLAAVKAGVKSIPLAGDWIVERLDSADDGKPDEIKPSVPRATLDELSRVQFDATRSPDGSIEQDLGAPIAAGAPIRMRCCG